MLFLLFGGSLPVPAIFYLLTLQQALERCSVESRTMSPGHVWLLGSSDFDKALGLALCILTIVSVIPLAGFVTGLAALV